MGGRLEEVPFERGQGEKGSRAVYPRPAGIIFDLGPRHKSLFKFVPLLEPFRFVYRVHDERKALGCLRGHHGHSQHYFAPHKSSFEASRAWRALPDASRLPLFSLQISLDDRRVHSHG